MTAVISPITYTGPRCQGCGGPCHSWKGSAWGYTCAACITAHLDAAMARIDAKAAKRRERLMANPFQTNVTNT